MINSPCINICKMDGGNQFCLGCFRTLDEIAVWSRADEATRSRILAAVAERRPEQTAAADGKPHE